MQPFLFGYDLYYLWSVGALLHQGGNPYDSAQLQHQLSSIGWPATEVPQRFTHPVNGLWLYWLISFLPFKVTLIVWSLLSLALVIGSTMIFAGIVLPKKRVSSPLLIFAAVMFPATLGTILWGQINAVLLSGLSLFALGWCRGHLFAAGLGLSLVLIKPHLFVPLLVVMILRELYEKRLSLIGGCLVGLLLQVGASYLIAPESFAWYGTALSEIATESLSLCGATIGQMIECGSDLRIVRPLLLGFGCVGAVWLVRILGYSVTTLTCVVAPLSLCVAPYCWSHSLVMLLPAFLSVVAQLCSRLSERMLRSGITCAAVLSLPLITFGGFNLFWVLLCWTIFVWAFTLRFKCPMAA